MLINNFSLKTVCIYTYFFAFCLLGFSQKNGDYYRFIDSADFYIDTSSDKALAFLDSIPIPLEDYVSGRLAEYYALKVLIHDDFKEYSKMHQSNILTLKYAQKEKAYKLAGQASIDLFSDLYFVNGDTTAFKYLEKAKAYYQKCNYSYGHMEVEQMYAYAKFLDGDYEACNSLLLEHLDAYRNHTEDAYFNMFAAYMLTSNYIYLDNFKDAHKYFKEFMTLKKNQTIAKFNHLSFESAIHVTLADIHFYNKQIDSTFYYLQKSTKLTEYMGEDVLTNYYDLYANVYKELGNFDASRSYMDSLMVFKDKIYKNNINASFQINKSLLKAESNLKLEKEKKFFSIVVVVVLVFILAVLSVFYFIFYRKQKIKIDDFNNKASNFSYLKSNNEKLAVKVQGLEDYINNLKKEVKEIATIDDASNQRERIKSFYKNLHQKSTTILNKSENHLELVNDLNVEFFKLIQEHHPELNKSETIICYYLFIGFNNKEIAVFLNASLRSIESKRYRISKKLNFNKQETTLVEYLNQTFRATKK
ncbi:hypothetical protein GCM10023311_01810 [Flaviramulus aquimarinus]|uniref:HTH luxR-type domain-containing protein n=1 Tax=Flaviramulus aquimarinus TaxID=1170456 RepID=A0ABP9EN72_9FLAO